MANRETVKVPTQTIDIITQYAAEGKPVRWISKQVNLSRFIVSRVIADNPAKIEDNRAGIKSKLYRIINLCLDNVGEAEIQKAGLTQKMITAGVAIDKIAKLEEGPQAPTNIIEQVNIIQTEKAKYVQLLESIKETIDV